MHAPYAGLEGVQSRLVSWKVPLVLSQKNDVFLGISHAFWKMKDPLVYLSAELVLSRPTDLSVVNQPTVWSFRRYVVGKRGSSRTPGFVRRY